MYETDLPAGSGRETGSNRVVGWVEAKPCKKDHPDFGICGRVHGHAGHHWQCAPEFIEAGVGSLGYR